MAPRTHNVVYSHTFQELREWVLKKAKVPNHFDFRNLGPAYKRFWGDINRVEYDRGYDPKEYAKSDSPALWQMKLLTKEEFKAWKMRFEFFHRSKS